MTIQLKNVRFFPQLTTQPIEVNWRFKFLKVLIDFDWFDNHFIDFDRFNESLWSTLIDFNWLWLTSVASIPLIALITSIDILWHIIILIKVDEKEKWNFFKGYMLAPPLDAWTLSQTPLVKNIDRVIGGWSINDICIHES